MNSHSHVSVENRTFILTSFWQKQTKKRTLQSTKSSQRVGGSVSTTAVKGGSEVTGSVSYCCEKNINTNIQHWLTVKEPSGCRRTCDTVPSSDRQGRSVTARCASEHSAESLNSAASFQNKTRFWQRAAGNIGHRLMELWFLLLSPTWNENKNPKKNPRNRPNFSDQELFLRRLHNKYGICLFYSFGLYPAGAGESSGVFRRTFPAFWRRG